MKKLVYLVVMVLCLPIGTRAQSKVATTSVPFLEIGVGARNVALGEASVSAVNDITALYWNPAGITKMKNVEVGFQHTTWFAGTQLQYAAGGVNLGNAGAIGVSMYAMGSGEMQVRTLEYEGGTGETFNVQDLSIGLSYAKALTDNFSIGGTAKFINSRLWRMSAKTMALDLGVQYQTPLKNLNLGFAISNFGGQMKLAGDNTNTRVDLDPLGAGDNDGLLGNLAVKSWDLPLLFRIGVHYNAVKTANSRLMITTNALYPNNNERSVNVGAEYAFREIFFLRAGMSNLFLPDANRGQGNMRLGFGLLLGGKIGADYAFADRGDLGSTNIIGATIRL
ncbi:MAG: PorV/PorQ family protein [Bacteroidetes Order II. Incertae sedis bacterium]|nr:PorV/PorQ family protein [Bacteroidetes Order II. bacterium]